MAPMSGAGNGYSLEGGIMKIVKMSSWIAACTAVLIVMPLPAQDKPLSQYISEAAALRDQGKLQEGIEVMKKAVEAYPNSPDAHLQYGLAQGSLAQNSGDMTVALKAVADAFGEMDKALALDPNHLETHLYYGAWGVAVPPFLKRYDAGVMHLETVLKLLESGGQENDQIKSAAYLNLGTGYKLQKKYTQSIDAFTRVLEMVQEGEVAAAARRGLEEVKNAQAHSVKIKAKEEADSPAVSALKSKLKENPGDFGLHVQIGKAYFDEEKYMMAAEVLRQALKIDSTNAEAQYLLARAVMQEASLGYDDRVYDDQSLRTGLAFESCELLEKAYRLAPDRPEIALDFAIAAIEMPFFVKKIDQGLALLEEMIQDPRLDEATKQKALYYLGYGYRKKGNAVWMKIASRYPKSEYNALIFTEYGLRESGAAKSVGKEQVLITFHIGFMDELAPQTAVWIEDAQGNWVKTLYVSGFAGHAREKQVNLPDWAKKSNFETDGTTAASIDWGKHTFSWDLTDHKGQKVNPGTYRVQVEISWWPTMKYGRKYVDITVGKKSQSIEVAQEPWIPRLRVDYIGK